MLADHLSLEAYESGQKVGVDDIRRHLMLHYYLLLLGQTNMLLVQNNRLYGFREFQKYTVVSIHEYSERLYGKRYKQLFGNNNNNCRHIEGRFSPAQTEKDNEDLIYRITRDFNNSNSRLTLIAHFIKKPETEHLGVRHELLRRDLRQRGEVLGIMIRKKHPLAEHIVGIDAAANEQDAPPEVFAEVYAMMRDAGVQHFTYHAGEDFTHVISGLRSVYETIEFLKYRHGDRIGHAVACGVSPVLWHKNMGDRIMMSQGDYMDSLLVMHKLIIEEASDSSPLTRLLPKIEMKISLLALEIYQQNTSIAQLKEAWTKRGEYPSEDNLKKMPLHVRTITECYHESNCRRRYDEIKDFETLEIFGEEELKLLQLLLLQKMYRLEIVIETLPTSNVIIGHHHSFSTYHLYQWYKWQSAGKAIPPIIVGTDDAGIFATNIYNEYCHIYELLVYTYHEPYIRVMEFIRWLNHNAEVYGFNWMPGI